MSRPGAAVPEGLVASVVSLVDTGPVHLGAYTAAELTAVDAIVDFLETRPSEDALLEAVRSLAARELLVAGIGDDDQLRVRGDLGIAVAFQQRARRVLDARVTGTAAGEPWRVLMMPQPEPISLVVRIDALGVHELGLFPTERAIQDLDEWLPHGENATDSTQLDPDALLDAADRSALITVTEYTTEGSAEIAGASRDLVLARHDGRVHAFARDPNDRARLTVHPHAAADAHELVAELLEPGPSER